MILQRQSFALQYRRGYSRSGNDPVYQTRFMGIREYRLDVPDGMYELTLHFTGCGVAWCQHCLITFQVGTVSRECRGIFNVLVNEATVLENFDIAAEYGVARAVAKKYRLQFPMEKVCVLCSMLLKVKLC